MEYVIIKDIKYDINVLKEKRIGTKIFTSRSKAESVCVLYPRGLIVPLQQNK